MREAKLRYQDPVEIIWTETARTCGMELRRSNEVFAAWDGESVLTIGAPETLDPDDCLAQMIFHELCHALVEGPDAISKEDWGLATAGAIHEHACLRLQAKLADAHGLRRLLASTTDFRNYYDSLPDDPIAEDGDPAVSMARAGWERAVSGPWSEPIEFALRRTAEIAALLSETAVEHSVWSQFDKSRSRAR